MPDEAALERALADLDNQDLPNYKATAEKHKVDRNTLSRRHKKQTEPTATAHLNAQGRLTAIQEEALMGWIDTLTKRKLPPAPGMIKNYVEHLIGEEIGKNWVSTFYHRHENELGRKYLDGLDAERVYATADQDCYKVWYQNVRSTASFEELALT
jgi:hypothetical protein